jgi:flagellar protein FlgJ
MQISAIQPKIDASQLPLESLAGNQALTENQKIAEASRQFEAILVRQFLSESQKPVIQSEFTDNSAESGIYQDFVTNQLAESLSRGGGIGLAQMFERQLSHPAATVAPAAGLGAPQSPALPAPATSRQAAGAPEKISQP